MATIDQTKDLGADGRFDASQYAFFGREVTQEVELGGLEDDDEDVEPFSGLEEEDREESGTPSELDDPTELANSFTKLRTDSAQPIETGFPEENVLPLDLEPPSWMDTQLLDNELDKRQWQLQYRMSPSDAELARSSAYTQQWGREAQNVPHNLLKSQGWPSLNSSPSANQYRQALPSFPSVVQYGNANTQQQLQQQQRHQQQQQQTLNPWLQGPGSPISGMGRHQLAQASLSMHPGRAVPLTAYGQMHPQQQPISFSQGQRIVDSGGGIAEQLSRSRQVPRTPDGSYSVGKNVDSAPQMRSKYMSAEEIHNLVRIQLAATHSTDPYVDDYYHQAVQAKQAAGTPHGRRHFAPSHLRDLPSYVRTAAEPHAFLQVDALGRIPYSSIRRPRPLLEVDGAVSTSGDKAADSVATQKRLEQEPMLMTRMVVEDGLCLLLDVDDIDRMLATSQPADGGVQLRRRRQVLLEGMIASLQLVDPLVPGRDANGRFRVGAKDDLTFLRLVSLPKGRNMLARYLRLLVPGSELVRIVSMAVFRHLGFLFGGAQSDPGSSNSLASAAASTVTNMDLGTLSTCLAAVVLASEMPPLRPIGSSSGDGATVILQAVLDRATAILSDRSIQCGVQNTAVWQASFDAFFNLLSKSCTNKYESIMHSLMMSSSSSSSSSDGNAASIAAAAASAMSKEMPIELLRSSLPHTNDQQRKRLLDLAQRSMVTHSSSSVSDGHANAAAAAAAAAVRG